MNYKALLFDLDGTAIPNKPDGIPSDNLVSVVSKIQETMTVSAATGRLLYNSKYILQKLHLTDPCILSGGTQIVDPVTEKILWEKDMTKEQVEQIMAVSMPYSYQIYCSDDPVSSAASQKIIQVERVIYIMAVTKDDAEIIVKQLDKIKNIKTYKVKSWTKDHIDIHITHAEATKKHAVEILLEMLHVQKEEVIAAGDSNNDLPLFEMAGYKIAMENGSDETKKKAHIIAPPADEDGLAKVLEEKLL